MSERKKHSNMNVIAQNAVLVRTGKGDSSTRCPRPRAKYRPPVKNGRNSRGRWDHSQEILPTLVLELLVVAHQNMSQKPRQPILEGNDDDRKLIVAQGFHDLTIHNCLAGSRKGLFFCRLLLILRSTAFVSEFSSGAMPLQVI